MIRWQLNRYRTEMTSPWNATATKPHSPCNAMTHQCTVPAATGIQAATNYQTTTPTQCNADGARAGLSTSRPTASQYWRPALVLFQFIFTHNFTSFNPKIFSHVPKISLHLPRYFNSFTPKISLHLPQLFQFIFTVFSLHSPPNFLVCTQNSLH